MDRRKCVLIFINKELAMTLPNLLIAGAPKCGTTSLFHLIKEHPDVFMPQKKEIWFFYNDELWKRGLSWYETFFAEHEKQKIVAEATPLYFCCEESIDRIKYALPNVKILLSLRNPVDRALSHYWMNVRKAKENLNIADAFYSDVYCSRNWKLPKGALNYFSIGLYDKHLKRIYSAFGKKNTHVIIFEDLVTNPAPVLDSLVKFLNLSSCFQNVLKESNKSKWLKSKNHRILYKNFIGKDLVSSLLPLKIKNLLIKARDFAMFEEKKPEIDKSLQIHIKEYYHESIISIEKMLGRKLDAWRKEPF